MSYLDENDNCILSFRGIDIYENDIDIIIEQYSNKIGSLDMLYKPSVFSGLLEQIYKRILKNIIPNNEQNNYRLLDDIFYSIYLPLCYRFNISPTIVQFCSLCHISSSNITDVKNGVFRSNHSKATILSNQIVKRWFDVVESGLLSKAVNESSIGSIFGLKALYGYRDNTTLTIEQGTQVNHESAEQIQERHKLAQLPTKLDL